MWLSTRSSSAFVSFYHFVRFPMCALKTPPLPFPVRHPMSEEKIRVFSLTYFFVVAGANQKSSSHFHCLKCDYYCTDTNKVRRGCIFCAYSLVLQCNIVTHVARQQKVREGKRQRKDEDKLHFANWNWELRQILQVVAHRRQHQKLDSIMAAGDFSILLVPPHFCLFSVIHVSYLCRFWKVHTNAILFNARMQSQWEANPLPLQVNIITF